MWTKPYTYKEGFVIGAGLIAVGVALQLSVGPLDWSVFRAPANFVTLAALVILIIVLHLLRKEAYAVQFLSSAKAAVPALVYATLLTATMGLTRQVPADGAPTDVLGFTRMLSAWPFVLVYLWMTLIVGLVTVKQLPTLLSGGADRFRRTGVFLCHLGLFVALSTATLGNADMQRLKMICYLDEPENRVVNEEGKMKQISVSIELKRFIFEASEEGMPRRFASDINIVTKAGENIAATVDVNHPVKVKGWKIYQYSYDMAAGELSRISILELVRDPWLPAVYAGIYILLAGAVLISLTAGRKGEKHTNQNT
ncbi:MAG: cytochrome c biogenesis protein ResB [Alloprevotella sp.]|nr:cytochrome c biogenesis protein ResB [Alloprevotella sp.]